MKTALPLVFLFLFASCLKEDDLKKPFVSYLPPAMDDGWEISGPAAENIDPAALAGIYEDFHGDPEFWQVRSLLVFRNGKLVAESYTKDDADRTTPRAIWSATKQVMGLLTGIAIEKQLIGSVGDPISAYLPQTAQFPDKKDIRIEDLLTMRSGIAYSNDGLPGQTDDILRQLPDKVTDFILGLPLEYPPGDTFRYKDGDPQVLSAVIQAKAGKPLDEWAGEVLFDYMQIENLRWNRYKDGVTFGAFGILTTPREMAKFGQLFLDGGKWKGLPLVSQAWLDEMTTVRVENAFGYKFGYLWWVDHDRGMVYMSGHGGQYVFIFPEKNLLVAMTAEVNTQGDFQFNRAKALSWVDRVAAAAL